MFSVRTLITTLLAALVVSATLFTLAPDASARDYRPWKKAMANWWYSYTDRWVAQWDQASYELTYVEDTASISFPPGYPKLKIQWKKRGWDYGCRAGAQYITAVEGELPCRQFTSELRKILRPYLPNKTRAVLSHGGRCCVRR